MWFNLRNSFTLTQMSKIDAKSLPLTLSSPEDAHGSDLVPIFGDLILTANLFETGAMPTPSKS